MHNSGPRAKGKLRTHIYPQTNNENHAHPDRHRNSHTPHTQGGCQGPYPAPPLSPRGPSPPPVGTKLTFALWPLASPPTPPAQREELFEVWAAAGVSCCLEECGRTCRQGERPDRRRNNGGLRALVPTVPQCGGAFCFHGLLGPSSKLFPTRRGENQGRNGSSPMRLLIGICNSMT